MKINTTLDLTEFNRAIKAYVKVSNKEASFAINKGMKDAAFRAIKHVKPGRKDLLKMFKRLARRDPHGFISPFVAYLMRKQGISNYTKAEAKRFGMKVFARRLQALGFLRGFFLAIAKRFQKAGLVGGGSKRGAKVVPGMKSAIRLATPNKLRAGIVVAYNYKRTDTKVAKANMILFRAMQKGLNEKAKDMWDYIRKKQAQKARAISVR